MKISISFLTKAFFFQAFKDISRRGQHGEIKNPPAIHLYFLIIAFYQVVVQITMCFKNAIADPVIPVVSVKSVTLAPVSKKSSSYVCLRDSQCPSRDRW